MEEHSSQSLQQQQIKRGKISEILLPVKELFDQQSKSTQVRNPQNQAQIDGPGPIWGVIQKAQVAMNA